MTTGQPALPDPRGTATRSQAQWARAPRAAPQPPTPRTRPRRRSPDRSRGRAAWQPPGSSCSRGHRAGRGGQPGRRGADRRGRTPDRARQYRTDNGDVDRTRDHAGLPPQLRASRVDQDGFVVEHGPMGIRRLEAIQPGPRIFEQLVDGPSRATGGAAPGRLVVGHRAPLLSRTCPPGPRLQAGGVDPTPGPNSTRPATSRCACAPIDGLIGLCSPEPIGWR